MPASRHTPLGTQETPCGWSRGKNPGMRKSTLLWVLTREWPEASLLGWSQDTGLSCPPCPIGCPRPLVPIYLLMSPSLPSHACLPAFLSQEGPHHSATCWPSGSESFPASSQPAAPWSEGTVIRISLAAPQLVPSFHGAQPHSAHTEPQVRPKGPPGAPATPTLAPPTPVLSSLGPEATLVPINGHTHFLSPNAGEFTCWIELTHCGWVCCVFLFVSLTCGLPRKVSDNLPLFSGSQQT